MFLGEGRIPSCLLTIYILHKRTCAELHQAEEKHFLIQCVGETTHILRGKHCKILLHTQEHYILQQWLTIPSPSTLNMAKNNLLSSLVSNTDSEWQWVLHTHSVWSACKLTFRPYNLRCLASHCSVPLPVFHVGQKISGEKKYTNELPLIKCKYLVWEKLLKKNK